MKKKNEFNYFDEFAKSAELAKIAIKELKEYILNFKSDISKEKMRKIHEIENQADDNLHNLKTFLLRDFLPPIDREDIVAIAHKIDDLVDMIDEIVINIDIYSITEITNNMKVSIQLLEKTIATTYDLVVEMKNLKNINVIKEKIVEVNGLEENADRLYEDSIRKLYQEEKDPIQVIKWHNMYESIENGFDACENIAECVEEVILKNS